MTWFWILFSFVHFRVWYSEHILYEKIWTKYHTNSYDSEVHLHVHVHVSSSLRPNGYVQLLYIQESNASCTNFWPNKCWFEFEIMYQSLALFASLARWSQTIIWLIKRHPDISIHHKPVLFTACKSKWIKDLSKNLDQTFWKQIGFTYSTCMYFINSTYIVMFQISGFQMKPNFKYWPCLLPLIFTPYHSLLKKLLQKMSC